MTQLLADSGNSRLCVGRESTVFRLAGLFDTMVLADPDTFGQRLERASLDAVKVGRGKGAFRFRAVKPAA